MLVVRPPSWVLPFDEREGCIRAAARIVDSATYSAGAIHRGGYISIFGSNLGRSRDVVGVFFSGSAAYQKVSPSYISPTQLNAPVPTTLPAGTYQVTVENGCTVSASSTIVVH